MKHLKIAVEQKIIDAETIAMEGIFDNAKAAIGKIVTKFKGSVEDKVEALSNNDKAVAEIKKSLQNVKSKISSTNFDSTQSKKAADVLKRLNIEASTASELIRKLKTIRSDMERTAREVARAKNDEQAEFAMKDLKDLFKGNGKIAEDMTFTKKELLEVLDCCIDLCDSYIKMRKIKNIGMENGGDLNDFIIWIAEVTAFFIRIILIVSVVSLILVDPVHGFFGAALAIMISQMLDAMIDKLRTT